MIGLLLALLAQATTTDPLEDACYERDHSQQGMNRCAGEAFERADKELNRHWREVVDHYRDPDTKKLLLEAQRSWLKYRDAQCELTAFHSRGGSMWPMIVGGCKADLTRQRNAELANLLGQGE
jgi:uncharacterized protein YecT (DUF1311 family)